MAKTVITSKNPDLVIGKVYSGMEGPWGYGLLSHQAFRVVERSTDEAWIDCNVAWGGHRDYLEMIASVDGPWYYYEIQTD